MKSIKEPTGINRKDLSGLIFFDGEDQHFAERKKMQMMQQKDWIDQQHKEKEARIKLAKEEEK